MTEKAILAATIFGLTYLGLALGKVPRLRMDRAAIAFVGAALMICCGVVPLSDALSPPSVNYQTLLLLLGMMIVVAVLRISGFFHAMADMALGRVTTPRGLLACTVLLSGLLSAFLVNDVVCLALTPLVIHLAARLRCDPVPHLIALATAANIGSVATITGNPQNMMIGVQSHIAYADFAAHLAPVALIGLVIDYLLISMICRARLIGESDPFGSPAPLKRLHVHRAPVRRLRRKAVAVTLVAIALFFAGVPVTIVAMAAAAVLLIDRIRPQKIYQRIDWSMLMMFFGLFVVVHAFNVHVVSRWGIADWHAILDRPVDLLSVASAALANLISNVPAVMLLTPLIQHVPAAKVHSAWLALAMSSTLAGNLTLLGSVANLIVAENARRHGVTLRLGQYCAVGIPLTLLTLAVGVIWLMI